MSEKDYNIVTSAFRSSGLLHLLRLMGTLVPSLHRESTDSMMCTRDPTFNLVTRSHYNL